MADKNENESGEAQSWALWKRLASGSNRERLGQSLGLLDQLSRRVRPPAPFSVEDLLEVDRLANGVAMDLCDWDAANDELDDAKLDRAVTAYVSDARAVFERYVEFRADVGARIEVALPAGIEGSIGLEQLARSEG